MARIASNITELVGNTPWCSYKHCLTRLTGAYW